MIGLEQFNNTICYDGERYQIGWPWKSDEPDLPENYDIAYNYGRLKSLYGFKQTELF